MSVCPLPIKESPGRYVAGLSTGARAYQGRTLTYWNAAEKLLQEISDHALVQEFSAYLDRARFGQVTGIEDRQFFSAGRDSAYSIAAQSFDLIDETHILPGGKRFHGGVLAKLVRVDEPIDVLDDVLAIAIAQHDFGNVSSEGQGRPGERDVWRNGFVESKILGHA